MRFPLLAVALAAVISGCGSLGAVPSLQNSGMGQSPFQASGHSRAGDYTLITQPDGSAKAAIFSAIDHAKTSIDLTMYILMDADVVTHMAQASARGVAVRVLLEQDPFYINTNVVHRPVPSATPPAMLGAIHGPLLGAPAPTPSPTAAPVQGYASNQQAARDLLAQTQQAKVPAQVFWTNDSRFALTHEKTLVVDQQTALITSINFTSAGLGGNREYGVIDRNPAEVQEVEAIFQADIQGTTYLPKQANLVVSPDDGSGMGNAKTKIMALIASAKSTIQIEDEEFQDPDVAILLGQMKAKGRNVEVLIDPSCKTLANAYLVPQKVTPLFWAPSGGHLHAKLVLVDGQVAYIGSVNLSRQSMGYNRELGILLSDATALGTLNHDFSSDWTAAGGTAAARRPRR